MEVVMIKYLVSVGRLILYVSMFWLVFGCAQPKIKYTNGDYSVREEQGSVLIKEATNLMALPGIISSNTQIVNERGLIIEELMRRNPSWGWDDINARRVSIGMSESEVLLSWGRPRKINRSNYGDQWIYKRGKYSAQYLYFKNGKLTGFNES